MKRTRVVLFLAVALMGSSVRAHAAQDIWSWLFSFQRMKEMETVKDAKYLEECGSCHFAYQPGWLPESSWRKLMTPQALTDHFGQNAELDEPDRKHLLDVLITQSAEKSYYKRSRKIMGTLPDSDAPLRITEVPYISRKHHDIPKDVFKNEKVKGLAFCDKCHTGANKGIFDDDTVLIPDRGNWTW